MFGLGEFLKSWARNLVVEGGCEGVEILTGRVAVPADLPPKLAARLDEVRMLPAPAAADATAGNGEGEATAARSKKR
jgi:hypothetical protein